MTTNTLAKLAADFESILATYGIKSGMAVDELAHRALTAQATPTDLANLAAEIWGAAQSPPGEGFSDAINRITALLEASVVVKPPLTAGAVLAPLGPEPVGMREKFEAHMSDNGKWANATMKAPGGGYLLMRTAVAWADWKACAATLSTPQAAPQAAQAQAGWRPIETAPDGKEFLAAIQIHEGKKFWWETHILYIDDGGYIDQDRFMGWDLEDYAGWQLFNAPPAALPQPPQPQGDA